MQPTLKPKEEGTSEVVSRGLGMRLQVKVFFFFVRGGFGPADAFLSGLASLSFNFCTTDLYHHNRIFHHNCELYIGSIYICKTSGRGTSICSCGAIILLLE